ncbi:hypothetical protein B0H14DRAFT_2564706 [Mycena olivaceomarginata]|nr:hypothetical protein B0H14DRAFT_2564706 [Mycena olivaceomarginata]
MSFCQEIESQTYYFFQSVLGDRGNYELCLEPLFSTLPPTSFLSKLANSVKIRANGVDTTGGNTYFEGGCNLLRMQRITGRLGSNSCKVDVELRTTSWMYDIFREHPSTGGQHNAQAFFLAYVTQFRSCVGAQPHWQTSNVNVRKQFELISRESKRFSGDLQKWFKILTRIHPVSDSPLEVCWYTVEGDAACEGQATVLDVIVGIPIMLVLHVHPGEGNEWIYLSNFRLFLSVHLCSRMLAWPANSSVMGWEEGVRLRRNEERGPCRPKQCIGKRLTHGKSVLHDSSSWVPSHCLGLSLAWRRNCSEGIYSRADKTGKKIGLDFAEAATAIPLHTTFTRPNIRAVPRDEMFWLSKDSQNHRGRTDWVALPALPKTPSPQKKGNPAAPAAPEFTDLDVNLGAPPLETQIPVGSNSMTFVPLLQSAKAFRTTPRLRHGL